VVGIGATGAMQWFLQLLVGDRVAGFIRRRFGQPRPGNRSMIGGMPG
jgi:hypothetical protein